MKPFLLLVLFLFSGNILAQTLEDDRHALVAIYNATSGDKWPSTRFEPWPVPGSPNDNPCGWYGITCTDGRVSQINLGASELSGTIPEEIENLTELTFLNLTGYGSIFADSRPPLHGTIPPGLFKLKKLEFLDLSGNEFSGNNIELIGNLTNLTYLAISPLWVIPDEIGNLIKLKSLYISCNNKYTAIGAIPVVLEKLINLKTLTISSAGVSGNIPKELGNLMNLEALFISDNLDLYGNIPGELGNLINLKELSLIDIKNAGIIPPELGNLVNLQLMRLQNDQLQGSIPAEFNKLKKLIRGFLDGNSLRGSIPDLSGMRNRALSITNNAYTFSAIEANESRFSSYYNQAKIPIINNDGVLSVNAGGTPANNTYRWYRNSILETTNVGDNSFEPKLSGNYRVEVTNSVANLLTLISNEFLNALPVTLISFSAKNSQNGNILTWQTTSETNNSGFDIEKSADAKTFEKIGFVDSNGDSKENKTYNFTDQTPFTITYYRLKQIDDDGRFEYSRIISIKQDHAGISIYPNPTADHFFVKDLENEEKIVIRNSSGQVVLEQKILPGQPVNSNNLVNGLYTITVGENTKKVVIQK